MRHGIWVLIMAAFFITVTTWAQENRGAVEFDIPAGQKGSVHFPHHEHQDAVKDCNVCHSVFPQKPGAIEELKGKGELADKQVMNELCRKCHEAQKKAGQKAGPTSCAKCHTK